MKRLKAIFSAIRVLGRNPHTDIIDAWNRVYAAIDRDCVMSADLHLVSQAIFGVGDEAEAWLKKQGEQIETPTA